MSDEALLRAVLEAPADDAVRLIYADWLDESGDVARAEFVRAQIKLAEYERTEADYEARRKERPWMLPYGGNCDCSRLLPEQRPCPFCVLRKRERELLAAHGAAWRQPVADLLGIWQHPDRPSIAANDGAIRFARGFVSSVTMPLAVFVGGQCEQCGGRGSVWPVGRPAGGPVPGPWESCSACGGRGTAPGVGKRLFETCPIVAVTLSDREPIAVSGRRMFGWISWQGECRMPHQIPADLHALLPEPPPETLIAVPGLYPSREAAVGALSLACVSFGRSAAGLDVASAAP